MDCVLEVQSLSEGCEIVGIRIHVVSVPRLGGAAMSSAIMRNDAEAPLAEEKHLRIPIIGGQGPAMAKHDGLSGAPVFVIDLCPVFGRDRRHKTLLFCGYVLVRQ